MIDIQSMYRNKIYEVQQNIEKSAGKAYSAMRGFPNVLNNAINAQNYSSNILSTTGENTAQNADTATNSAANTALSSTYAADLTDDPTSLIYSNYAAAIQAGILEPDYSYAYNYANSIGTNANVRYVQSAYGNPKTQEMTPAEYEPLIQQSAAKYDLDPELVRGIIRAESSFNPKCVSSAGAKGLMQLMHYHTKDIDPYDPAQNIDRGCEHFKDYLDRLDGDIRLALAAYNCGIYRITRDYGVSSSSDPNYNNISERVRTYVERVLDYAGMTDLA